VPPSLLARRIAFFTAPASSSMALIATSLTNGKHTRSNYFAVSFMQMVFVSSVFCPLSHSGCRSRLQSAQCVGSRSGNRRSTATSRSRCSRPTP
jgi:hypothetical protein